MIASGVRSSWATFALKPSSWCHASSIRDSTSLKRCASGISSALSSGSVSRRDSAPGWITAASRDSADNARSPRRVASHASAIVHSTPATPTIRPASS
ncbi:hypothetical protein ACFJIX_04985 [Roseateles sp. UC29_93]|uniref:hypothetical protein n=1 Tax=Roseateles sp. UC29_93 TaxID=3350177 RepID=UPI00366B7108